MRALLISVFASFLLISTSAHSGKYLKTVMVHQIEGHSLKIPTELYLAGDNGYSHFYILLDLKELQATINKIVNKMDLKKVSHTHTQVFGFGDGRLRIKAHFNTSGTRGSLESFLNFYMQNNQIVADVRSSKINISNDLAAALANITGIRGRLESELTNEVASALSESFRRFELPEKFPHKVIKINEIKFTGELANLKAQINGAILFP